MDQAAVVELAGAAVVPRRCRSQSAATWFRSFEFRAPHVPRAEGRVQTDLQRRLAFQRDYLYVPNMHGADWPRMKQMYGQFMPYVMHRADLNYLLDMMGAEIAVDTRMFAAATCRACRSKSAACSVLTLRSRMRCGDAHLR